ncbi:MAG: hypothetical protein QXW80_05345 [Candidatus Micrarchaeia archaeon]
MRQYMIGDNIKRVEEIRYLISKKTFELMKYKLSGRSNLEDLESELDLLKQEMANHLSSIQDAGYVYILINKKEIEKLKEDFTKLSQEEKANAFKEIGKGYEILSKSNLLLKKNYENRETIATLILSLPGDDKIVQIIKNYLEGYSNDGEFKLESQLASSRISSLISSLGFISSFEGEKVILGNSFNKNKLKEEIVKDVFPIDNDIIETGSDLRRQEFLDSHIREQINDIEETKPIPAQILDKNENEIKENYKESTGQSQLSSEDLQPNLTYNEVCQKIEEIMNNYKMKRWVLGAFKDDEEKKQYEKIQSLLIKLMRLKQSMEEKGEK